MAETVRKNLGMVTAYAYAVSKGYSGTEEKFAELMASYADVAQDAEASAQAAAQSATTAEQKATQAAGSATNAAGSATSASESAQAAAGSSNSASLYAQNASASAINAAGSASSASTYAGNASASAQAAEGFADAAQEFSTQAAGSADDAEAAKDLVLGMNAVANTLPAGSQATASYSNGTLTLGIPKGDTGEKGDPGDTNDAPLIYSSASGSVANFTDGADNLPMKSAVVSIEPIQEGSGDPSPENVRPISGRTGLSVVRSGKNLLPMPIVSGSYDYTTTITVNDDKSFVINKTSSSGWSTFILGRFTLKPGTYTLIESDDNNANSQLVLDKVIGGTTEVLITTRYNKRNVFTIEADTLVQARYTRSGIADNVLTKLMLFIGNTATATDYEPYKGSTYSVNLETEAGTVYGGYVDLVSGKLIVDRAIETITKDSNWYSFSTGSGNSSAVVQLANIPLYVIGSSNKNGSICSSGLELQNYWTSARQNESGITDNGYAYTQTGVLRFHRLDVSTITTLAEFKSAFPDTQVCYKLATPTEIQLTQQEVRTLLGVNNIWSDGGDMAAEYPADTKLYIDQKITEAIAAALA